MKIRYFSEHYSEVITGYLRGIDRKNRSKDRFYIEARAKLFLDRNCFRLLLYSSELLLEKVWIGVDYATHILIC